MYLATKIRNPSHLLFTFSPLQATSEYAEYISKRHAAFKSYRDATVSKWSEKTRLASGKLNSKVHKNTHTSIYLQPNLRKGNHIVSNSIWN